MNGLDWLIAVILVVSTLLAASRGFVMEVISLAGAVLGYLLAAWNYPRAAQWFRPYVNSDWLAAGFGFILIFVGVLLVAGVVARVVQWVLKQVGVSWMDRLLGMGFGFLRGGLIVVVLLLGMTSFGLHPESVAKSRFAPFFLTVARGFTWVGPGELRHHYQDGLRALENLPHTT